jgi:hypothetical protein
MTVTSDGRTTATAMISAVTTTARPEWPTLVDEMRWSDETYPGSVRVIAELDGRAVGVATVGRRPATTKRTARCGP